MNDQQQALASELNNRDKKRQAAMDEQKRDADGKFGSGGGSGGYAKSKGYDKPSKRRKPKMESYIDANGNHSVRPVKSESDK